MAAFTMYLHELLGSDSPRDADYSLIGLDEYPIWDEGYRSELNHKIMMRFWNREIGFETPLMFTHHVRRVMGEIMPYYNKLAVTTLWDFDPFETMNVTSDATSKNTGQTDHQANDSATQTQQSTTSEESISDSQQQAESASRSVAYEHPQTQLYANEDYATSSQESKTGSTSDTKSSGEAASKGSQDGESESESQSRAQSVSDGETTSTQRGFQGDRSALLQNYRDTIMGIDTQILEELEVLFMGIWDTDDAYTQVESPYPYLIW